jgi:hypothetical protein
MRSRWNSAPSEPSHKVRREAVVPVTKRPRRPGCSCTSSHWRSQTIGARRDASVSRLYAKGEASTAHRVALAATRETIDPLVVVDNAECRPSERAALVIGRHQSSIRAKSRIPDRRTKSARLTARSKIDVGSWHRRCARESRRAKVGHPHYRKTFYARRTDGERPKTGLLRDARR